MGKVLTINENEFLTVTGVLKDLPENTIFEFDMLVNIEHVPDDRLESWSYSPQTYIVLAEGVSSTEFQTKIDSLYTVFDQMTKSVPSLQNLKDIHLNENGKPLRIIYVKVFSLIAIIILLLACINYLSLNTARSVRRAKEIGLRKVIGANKRMIIFQFLGESFLFSVISMILALILVEVVRPSFNSLTQKSIYIHYTDPTLIIGLLSILIITGLVAGLYPAIVLSSFKPIRILKGVFTSGKGGRKFINILVVIQFSISISLIIVSIVVGKQMHFINNKDLGLNKENVIVIPYNQEIAKRFDGFKEELMSNPSIVNVSAAYNLPTDHNSYVGLNWEGNPSEEGIGIIYNMVDYDFIETVGMKMLAGRSFSKDFADDDSISYIINETALRRMNDKNPIGLNVKFLHPGFPERFKRGKIIGVVKDFHLRPLREEIIPFAMRVYRPWYFHILIKYNTTDVHGLIDYLQGISIKYAPESPFSYSFFDQEVSKLYTLEYKAGKLITYFTILSIIISCMGLLGLTIQELEQKRKQVGIRKTLGASTSNLILSFSFSFLKRLVISFVIASVIGVFAIEKILQDYAYKTEITIWIFVGAFAIAIFIALATIIFQTYKASVKNPMESLKYE